MLFHTVKLELILLTNCISLAMEDYCIPTIIEMTKVDETREYIYC